MPDNAPHHLSVDPDGNWRLYTVTLPAASVPLGTVRRANGEIGALVRFQRSGMYVQINAGAIRNLDPSEVHAALLAAQCPRGTQDLGLKQGAGKR